MIDVTSDDGQHQDPKNSPPGVPTDATGASSPDAPASLSTKPNARDLSKLDTLFTIRQYRKDAYGEANIKPRAKDGDEWRRMHSTESESTNSRIVTIAGVLILGTVTLFACLLMMGITYNATEKAHEDAIRIILLVIGGVIGALYGAKTGRSHD